MISRTDYPELRFVAGAKLYLVTPKSGELVPVVIKSVRMHKSQYLVVFEGYEAIEKVEHLRGSDLKVDRSQAPPLPAGQYWIDDLLGCRVESDKGVNLGTIVEVLTPGANDVYVVRGPSGKDILIPAIAKCILEVDIAEQFIKVHLMPGLLD